MVGCDAHAVTRHWTASLRLARVRMTAAPGEVVRLPTGAEMRLTGDGATAVVCVNGGRRGGRDLERVDRVAVRRLAPRFRQLVFAEVRYRVKSWRHLEACVEDARAAVHAAGAHRTLLLGFSMGGAVAISMADEPSVEQVLGLAPWIPDRLSRAAPRSGSTFCMDRSIAGSGIPGVSPSSSRRGFERARALGVAGRYELIPGALHAIALRTHWGRPVPLPRAAAWERRVAAQLTRSETAAA